MKLTKRILCLALALVLILAVAACGNDNKKDPLEDERSNNLPAPSDTTTSAANDSTTSTTADPLEGNLTGDVQYNDATFAW